MMVHLGFPVRIVGKPALRSHDSRLSGHLSVSLACLLDVLGYLRSIQVRFYRLASTFIPVKGVPSSLQQIHESLAELALLSQQISEQGVRLTMHLEHHIALGSQDPALVQHSIATIDVQALLLDHLCSHLHGVIVVHVGGSDPASLERFATHYAMLSSSAKSRLVVEHDTTCWSFGKLLSLHQRCGIPIVFDYLHHQLHNPERIPLDLALGLALASWPPTMRPKVHISTVRSEAHLLAARKSNPAKVLPPRPGQHADFIAPNDIITLLDAARGLPPFDLMIEAKAGDLALLRLRSDIARLAPTLAPLLA